MLKLRIFIAAALLLLVVSAAAQAAAVKATLKGLKGDVSVRVTATADWKPAAEGAMLPESAAVKTGADSEATLLWADGHAAKVAAMSIVKIEASDRAGSVSKTQLSMEKGRVTARVAKLQTGDSVFNIKTPVATAGVRGTAFDCAISSETNQLAVSVVEGSVYVAVGDIEVAVAEGFASTVMPGGVPQEPVAIPPQTLQNLKTSVGELKEASDSAAAPEAEKAPAAEAQDVTESVTDNVIEDTTIQNTISDTQEEILQGCPSGGGCIQGTIEF